MFVITKSKRPAAFNVGQLELTPDKAVDLLRRHSNAGLDILSRRPINADKHSAWILLARSYLEKTFGANSPHIASITNVGRYGGFALVAGEAWSDSHRADSLRTQIAKINSLIGILETECELLRNDIIKSGSKTRGRQIFLIHDHDHSALHETARFLGKLQQEVVILHVQQNQGKNIVENFEECANAGFAVVFLAAGGRGGIGAFAHDGLHPRARQNIIFGLGYFIGKLGRNRVCGLFEPDVEIPSDYAGVLCIEMDKKGAWHLHLARELKAAGLPVDMNNVF